MEDINYRRWIEKFERDFMEDKRLTIQDIELNRLMTEYKAKKIDRKEYILKALPILKDIVENHEKDYDRRVYEVHKNTYNMLKTIWQTYSHRS